MNAGDAYSVPRDNPFVGRTDALPEIWAYGIRNVWRMSFDAGGKLFGADVGQNKWESVKVITKGANLGWNRIEGSHCFNADDPNNEPATCDKTGLTMPVIEYGNMNVVKDGKGLSITGGYVYRGKANAEPRGRVHLRRLEQDLQRAPGRVDGGPSAAAG